MKNRYKRALVTGGAGFIGSHIVDRLVESGMETVVIDDLSTGKKENVSSKAKLIVGSILSRRDLKKAMKGVDVVFHNAAKVSVRNSFQDIYDDTETNVMGTVNVLNAMAENKARKIILASSMAVYGKNKLPVPETGMLEPVSPYGVGKLASEKYCFLMSAFYRFDAVVLRYFNTYGPKQTLTPYVGVITIFINRLLRGEAPVIFGDGKQNRDFIHVKDVAEANILAMMSDCARAVLNVGTGRGTKVSELARLLIDEMGSDLKPEYEKAKPGELADSVADIRMAKDTIGFIARYRLRDMIAETVGVVANSGRGVKC
ncbi:MAG: SDR family NAD(P)-dependent oxidoreductase [Candidatus Omnitrophota bacterium]